MIAPWPGMRRGTDCTVPRVPGLVRVDVAPAKSSARELVGADLADQVLVGVQNPRKSRVSAPLIRARAACGCRRLLDVDGEPEADVLVADDRGLAVVVGHEAEFMDRHLAQRPDDGVADQVGEADLAAAACGPGGR